MPNSANLTQKCCLLTSLSSFVPYGSDTLRCLKEKLPPVPPVNQLNWLESPENLRLVFISYNTRKVISSFPTGSGVRIDGLWPQQLKEGISLSAGNTGLELLENLTKQFSSVNIFPYIFPLFFGAKLFWLMKRNGDICPIAIGCILSCLTAKVCLQSVSSLMEEEFV